MARYVMVSLLIGIVFAVLDGLIHANPLAQRLYSVYQPIAKSSVNAPAGLVIDLVYGFVITGIFILLFKSLPGSTGLMRGVSFAVLVWFLRVVMGVVGGWMTLNVPAKLHVYELLTGLGEMGILGVFLGIAFRGKIGVSG